MEGSPGCETGNSAAWQTLRLCIHSTCMRYNNRSADHRRSDIPLSVCPGGLHRMRLTTSRRVLGAPASQPNKSYASKLPDSASSVPRVEGERGVGQQRYGFVGLHVNRGFIILCPRGGHEVHSREHPVISHWELSSKIIDVQHLLLRNRLNRSLTFEDPPSHLKSSLNYLFMELGFYFLKKKYRVNFCVRFDHFINNSISIFNYCNYI